MRNLWKGLSALVLGTLLGWAAVSGAPQERHRQVAVEWQEEGLLLVGDTRNGDVRVFRLGSQPTPVGILWAPDRDAVVDIRLDPETRGFWVVGRNRQWLYALEGDGVLARVDRPGPSRQSSVEPHSAAESMTRQTGG